MDARREFIKYDQKNKQACAGTVLSTKVMRFNEVDTPICVQMREDKRKVTVKKHGSPTYFTRILFRTKFGTLKMVDYSRYLFSSPEGAMKYLKTKIHENRDKINQIYRKGL